MSTGLKYGICVGVGLFVQIVGLFWLMNSAFAFSPVSSAIPKPPLPTDLTFVFPYVGMVIGSDGLSKLIGVVLTLFQMPVYGFILAKAWTQGVLRAVIIALLCVHSLVAFCVLMIL